MDRDWGIYRGVLHIFDGSPLTSLCAAEAIREKERNNNASEFLDPCYKTLMLFIFKQALYDYMMLPPKSSTYASAKRWLKSLDDLSFISLPGMSGIDVLTMLDSNWEVFYRIHKAIIYYDTGAGRPEGRKPRKRRKSEADN